MIHDLYERAWRGALGAQKIFMRRTAEVGVIAGHSHLVAFGVPLRTEDGHLTLTSVNPGKDDFLCLNGPFPRDENYWLEAEKLAAAHPLFIYWHGNQHMAAHLFASDPPLDFVLSDDPSFPIANDSVLIPEEMLREEFAQFVPSFDQLDALLKRVMGATHRGIFVCGTPPPKEDTAAMRASLGREAHFVERLAALRTSPDAIPLTPPLILYKMWRVIQNMLRDVAQKNGAQFLPIPPEAQTPDGFLRKECWSSDVTHANSNLGRLILPRLRKCL
ncbi:MAG: hypothetical protein QOF41_465 [Methylobacteriaceae bacterium]|jgi:hypothetical protein|nr:hypothetical protein [Methylobacteriaceae bacterium]